MEQLQGERNTRSKSIGQAKAKGEDDFPLFAAGISHRCPYKDGPGEINVPIAIDGMVIEPGDLIIGDDDGLLCVPFDQVAEVYDRAAAKHAAENKQMEQIAQGTNDRSWVLESLKKEGCLLPKWPVETDGSGKRSHLIKQEQLLA